MRHAFLLTLIVLAGSPCDAQRVRRYGHPADMKLNDDNAFFVHIPSYGPLYMRNFKFDKWLTENGGHPQQPMNQVDVFSFRVLKNRWLYGSNFSIGMTQGFSSQLITTYNICGGRQLIRTRRFQLHTQLTLGVLSDRVKGIIPPSVKTFRPDSYLYENAVSGGLSIVSLFRLHHGVRSNLYLALEYAHCRVASEGWRFGYYSGGRSSHFYGVKVNEAPNLSSSLSYLRVSLCFSFRQ